MRARSFATGGTHSPPPKKRPNHRLFRLVAAAAMMKLAVPMMSITQPAAYTFSQGIPLICRLPCTANTMIAPITVSASE